MQVQSDLSPEDRLFLIGSDPDPFNRWEAAQKVALAMLERATSAIRRGEAPAFDPRFAEELGRLAMNEELDAAFKALALTLPSETDIAQAISRDVDPDAIHRARQALEESIGRAIGASVLEAAARSAPGSAYSPDAEDAGRRAFTHAAWNLAVAGGRMQAADLARFYRDAGNLTDRLAALRLLVHRRLDGCEDALTSFFGRYRGNPLVLDKWFAVQATAPTTLR